MLNFLTCILIYRYFTNTKKKPRCSFFYEATGGELGLLLLHFLEVVSCEHLWGFFVIFFVLMLPKQLQTRSKGYRQRLSLTSILANHNMNSHYSTILLPFFHFLNLSVYVLIF